MKRKLILPLMILLLLTGCAKGGETAPSPAPVEYGTPDRTGVNVVWIRTPSGLIPVARTVNGNGTLKGENYYYQLQATVDGDGVIGTKTLTAFDADGNFLGAVADSELQKADPYTLLVTTGNWQLSPAVRHTRYSAKEDAGDGYKQFIFESFPDRFGATSDVCVTDLWEYDLDGDGANDAIIRAIGKDCTVLAVQSPALGSRILDFYGEEGNYDTCVYFTDAEGDGSFALMTVCGNALKKATVYRPGTLEVDYTVFLPLEKK